MALTIGVDVGGTKVIGGVVDADGRILAQARRPTPAYDQQATLDMIIEVIGELAAAYPVTAVGVGAAGWIDETRSRVLFAPNLAWRDAPLRDEIRSRIDLPLFVENDANVAAWAEFTFGAGRDVSESMVLFTIGTGIGGGIVLGGQLVRGSHGMAAELGHVRVVPDGHLCGCGRHGCIEQYASGNALVRFARTAAKEQPDSAVHLLELAGGSVDAIVGSMVTAAARMGDEAALCAFAEVGYWLGNSMADMVQILDPQLIVIGGGVIDAGELLVEPAERAYRVALEQRGRLPVAEVRAARLGNLAGLVGAADLARHA